MDPRTEKLASILVNYCTAVKPGDMVVVYGDVAGLPLIEATVEHVYQAGGNPILLISSDAINESMYRYANTAQLEWVSPLETLIRTQADVTIAIIATPNTHSGSGYDIEKQRIRQKSRTELAEIFRNRAAEGLVRWTLTQFPCEAYAQDADMSLREYEDFVYGATFADKEDPVAEWLRIHDEQQRLVDWLKGKKHVQVKGPNVDLTLSIEDRIFLNSDGKRNMPSGEIFTGPVEDSANGWVHFTYPAIRGGREVEGVELEFKDGKVVKARAKKNEEYLISQLDADAGARFLGEFAIGTNYGITKFTKSILFDEKIGGSFHMAVGSSYPETGGKNKSVVHWDFICDMRDNSEIVVDGELFYKNGQFVV